MASELQIQANRQNALKSTGPRETTLTRFNAVTHGLLAKNLLIDTGEGKEKVDEFQAILAAFQADLAPEGAIQEVLVETLACAYYRKKRALLTEKGLLRSNLDNNQREAEDAWDELRKLRQLQYPVSRSLEPPDYEDLEAELEQCNDFLKQDITSVEMEQKKERITQIQRELKWQDTIYRIEHKQLKQLAEERFLRQQIPFRDDIERVLRYETAMDRQFYRALDKLTQLKQSKIGFVSQKVSFEKQVVYSGSLAAEALP